MICSGEVRKRMRYKKLEAIAGGVIASMAVTELVK